VQTSHCGKHDDMKNDRNSGATANADRSSARKRGAPGWALKPFEDFVAYTERLGQIVHLSVTGISALRGIPRVVEVLAKVQDKSGDPQSQAAFARAKKEAELAQQEIDEGFPVLHAQAVIALWSALEAAVRVFVARWLQHHNAAMEVEAVQKLRVRIGEYERLEGEDRFFYILDRLEQELSASLRSGVTRFETILEPFGLSGGVEDEVRRNVFELNHVRNVLVHRSGVADRRLVEACPWLGLSAGDPVKIDHRTYERYLGAVMNYDIELIARVGERFGVDMSEHRTGPIPPSSSA